MSFATTMPKPTLALDLDRRFQLFVDAHRERAVRLAWRLVGGDDAAAEDVAQEAFLRALRALPRFREEAQLSTWFYRILVRQAYSHTRKRATRRRLLGLFRGERESEQRVVPCWPDPGLQRRIGRALLRLSRQQREVFVLVHMEGLTVAETARILDRAPGTIKSHLHRALVKMRADLADLSPASREGIPNE